MATTITARPPQGIHVHHKPIRCVPGITRGSRTVACPAPDARPGPHVGCRISWAAGWGFGVTVVPWVAAGGPCPRTCQSLGGRLSGATCAMHVYGQGNGGCILPTNP